MQEIKVIPPEDELYTTVDRALKTQVKRYGIDYNAFAKEYNQAEEGSIVLILAIRNNIQVSNVSKVLERRGLVRNTDFSMSRMVKDFQGNKLPKGEAPIAIKKLSDAEINITTT